MPRWFRKYHIYLAVVIVLTLWGPLCMWLSHMQALPVFLQHALLVALFIFPWYPFIELLPDVVANNTFTCLLALLPMLAAYYAVEFLPLLGALYFKKKAVVALCIIAQFLLVILHLSMSLRILGGLG